MAKLKCCLKVYSKSVANKSYTRQIITGFMMLEKQGIIQLEINYIPKEVNQVPFPSIVEAKVNDKLKIAYDLLDGYNFDSDKVKNYLKNVDFYFKRSYSIEKNKELSLEEKIFPLGFNYNVTSKKNFLDRGTDWNLLRKLKYFLKDSFGLSYQNDFFVEKFEDFPFRNKTDAQVLFTTRTWNPTGENGEDNISEDLQEERNYINKMRTECIRRLRKVYGQNFIGGLSPTKYSIQHYPDCVLDKEITKRVNFMRLVKKADICIASKGLHQSIGWKMGEYIAASKAIVSEKLDYDVPGNFVNGRNYLEFTSVDEFVDKTLELVNDKDLTYEMKVNNFMYYHHYLRPDMLVLNSLITTLKKT